MTIFLLLATFLLRIGLVAFLAFCCWLVRDSIRSLAQKPDADADLRSAVERLNR